MYFIQNKTPSSASSTRPGVSYSAPVNAPFYIQITKIIIIVDCHYNQHS